MIGIIGVRVAMYVLVSIISGKNTTVRKARRQMHPHPILLNVRSAEVHGSCNIFTVLTLTC